MVPYFLLRAFNSLSISLTFASFYEVFLPDEGFSFSVPEFFYLLLPRLFLPSIHRDKVAQAEGMGLGLYELKRILDHVNFNLYAYSVTFI